MKPEIIIFKNTEEIATEFAGQLQKIAENTNGKPVHIALSGGSTPKAIFEILTQKYNTKLANKLFHFWWGDDRCVPPTDDDSNYKWANDLWLTPIGIPEENIHRIKGESKPFDEAKRYEAEIKIVLPKRNGLPQFDYILLGIGEDGHTASIFPHQMELLISDKLCEVATHPISGQKRISFTGKLINNAKHVAFLATGKNKAMKVAEIIHQKKENLPATHIHPINGKLTWFLDNESAVFLK